MQARMQHSRQKSEKKALKLVSVFFMRKAMKSTRIVAAERKEQPQGSEAEKRLARSDYSRARQSFA